MRHIALSDFVRRQTAGSRFSHFAGTDAELLRRVEENFSKAKPGYRDGVLLVPVDPDGFFTSTVLLREGDKFEGVYEPRQKGEAPRKHITVIGGKKAPAIRVEIVLYRKDVLAEGKENTMVCPNCEGAGVLDTPGTEYIFGHPVSCNCSAFEKVPIAEWEIISNNAPPTEEPEPMSVGTLLANHFHVEGSNDGGTSTGMSDAELVAALRKSFTYWRDKAQAG